MKTRRKRLAAARRTALLAAILGTTALVTIPRAEAQDRIDYIYSPEPDHTDIYIEAINRAGTHVAGQWRKQSSGLFRATLWGPDGQPVDLDTDVFSGSYATGLSDDGSVVVGSNTALAAPGAFRWSSADGIEYIGTLGGNRSWAYDVSGDGNTVVGRARRADFADRGFVWIKGATTGVAGNRQMYELQELSDHADDQYVEAISGAGRYVIGSEHSADGWQPVRWDIGGLQNGNLETIGLGTLTGTGADYAFGSDISDDGRVVIGHSETANRGGTHAYRWVEGATGGVAANRQMYDLGTLGGDHSWGNAVSGDGNIVVGQSTTASGLNEGFRWSEATGMVAVAEWLRGAGVDVGTNVIDTATDTSADGSVVVGRMYTLAGEIAGYIARVAPVAGPGPGPGTGMMDINEYHRSLFSTTSIANAGQYLAWLPMNGAHHRPLMTQASLTGDTCVWATGDLGYHGGSDTGIGLAETGACVDLFGGNVRAGLGVGTSRSWQTLALGGSSDLAGQYVVGEIDWQPDGTPLLLSVTGMLGGWQADVHRGYSNGAATAYSDGQTQLGSGVIRLRADWLEAAVIGNTSINPWASVGIGRMHVDGYVENGGPFPARFDGQSLASYEVRLGVTAVTQFSASTSLSTTFEVAHQSGDAASANGNVTGLFDFSLGGGRQSETWMRIGADLDHKISENVALSVSLNAATQGRDASVGGSIGLKAAF
jgi:probable HAF family extracellular repeat protein